MWNFSEFKKLIEQIVEMFIKFSFEVRRGRQRDLINSKTYCIDPLIPGGSNRSHKLEQTSTEHFALSADYYNGQQ